MTLRNFKILILAVLAQFCAVPLAIGQNQAIQLSHQLLNDVYQKQIIRYHLEELDALSITALKESLSNDDIKKAFWINIYNVAVQISLTDSMGRANEKEFFNNKVINVAGISLSLNDIEHGLLRHSKTAKGKKKRTKWRISTFERTFRVEQSDWHVFFALNTGISSDPYIYFHSPDGIDRELKQKMLPYLSSRTNDGILILPFRYACYWRDGGDINALKSEMGSKSEFVKEVKIESSNKIIFKPRYFIGSK